VRRRHGALLLLIVLLVVLPISEVWLLIEVGRHIGLLPTVGILVAEAVLGGWLMRREGARAWRALESTFREGRMPTGELADAALVLVGGVLLMLPGFITDVFGFLFLLPLTRPIARHLLGFLVARRLNRMGLTPLMPEGGKVIPGEVIDFGGSPPGPAGRQDGPNRVIRGEIEDD
jgi:UPF0716 protein FxsA